MDAPATSLRHVPLYIEALDGSSTEFDWGQGSALIPPLTLTLPPVLRHVPLYIQAQDGTCVEFNWRRLATHEPTPGALLPLWGGVRGRTTPCSTPVWEAETVSWFFGGVLTARAAAAWAAISSLNSCVCMDVGSRAHVFTTAAEWDAFAGTASAAAETIFVHYLRTPSFGAD